MESNGKMGWAFAAPVFWKTFWWGLSISVLAKFLVNIFIPPHSNLRSALISDTIFPNPPGRFAITHAEHWYDGWPDYSDGIFGAIATRLAGLLEKFVQYDNMELWIWLAIFGIWLFWMSAGTIGKNRESMLFTYIGLGLMFAALVSNQGEVALFGHATDFIYFRPSESFGIFVVFNLADVMGVLCFVLVIFVSPIYSKRKARDHEGLTQL